MSESTECIVHGLQYESKNLGELCCPSCRKELVGLITDRRNGK